jgi:very-short-patch-repair endonuclease
MIERNPMHKAEIRQRVRTSLIAMGHKPPIRGGNGTGLTRSQSLLLSSLGMEWTAEYGVRTFKPRDSGYPGVYKLDLAHPSLKVGVDVDGNSHGLLLRQEQDAKKDALLRGLGWTVLRFRNAEVLENLTDCVQTVMSTISKLSERIPTSPMAS